MRARTLVVAAVLAAFTCAFFAIASLLLPSCGVAGSWHQNKLFFCSVPVSVDRDDLVLAHELRVRLERRITELQQDISFRQCEITTRPPGAPEVDEYLWNDGNLEAMHGCWTLDYTYRVTDVHTREVSEFNDWTICFNKVSGIGSQIMRSTTGIVCESDILGSFNAQGQLVLEEIVDLLCDDDTSIFQRINTCDRTADGGLSCISFQPRGGASDRFRMSRQ